MKSGKPTLPAGRGVMLVATFKLKFRMLKPRELHLILDETTSDSNQAAIRPVGKIRAKPATSIKSYRGNVIRVGIVSGFKLVG